MNLYVAVLIKKSNRICIKNFTCRRCTRNYSSFYLKPFRKVNWAEIPNFLFPWIDKVDVSMKL